MKTLNIDCGLAFISKFQCLRTGTYTSFTKKFDTDVLVLLNFKQAVGNNVVTVGYIMKPSREEDFAKVSP